MVYSRPGGPGSWPGARVRYVVSGKTDKPGQLYIVLIYNNRGLHIDGRRLQVVTLHE